MRWPGANLEEKHEPRGVSVAEAQNGDSMKSSRRSLTLAAIEKGSFTPSQSFRVGRRGIKQLLAADLIGTNRGLPCWGHQPVGEDVGRGEITTRVLLRV